MIALKRLHTPVLLNPTYVSSKTIEFKATNANVWNVPEIKEGLLELSYNKCAYCECDILKESKYLEVEHFEDKSSYPDKVLHWDNLLPSCKRCNGKKGSHDVNLDPIINPFLVDPKNHISFHLYRFKGKTKLGKTTIEVVDLNDTTRIVIKRFEIGEQLQKTIETIFDRLEAYKENNTTQRKNKLITLLEEVLRLCQPDSVYAATCATVLHSNKTYTNVVTELKMMNLWTSQLEEFHNVSKKISLDIE